jgi:hypothetical protein
MAARKLIAGLREFDAALLADESIPLKPLIAQAAA